MTSSLKFVQDFVAEPSVGGLSAWQKRMGFTYESAAQALGMSRSAYGSMLAGEKDPQRNVTKKTAVDRRTALACLAIEMGLSPFTSNIPAPVKKRGRKPKTVCQDPATTPTSRQAS